MIFTISPRIFVPRCILLYKYVLYTLLSKTHRRVWHLNKNINVKEHRNAPHTHHSRKSFYLFRNKYNIITVYLNTGVFMTETSSGEWPCAKLQICVCHFVHYITLQRRVAGHSTALENACVIYVLWFIIRTFFYIYHAEKMSCRSNTKKNCHNIINSLVSYSYK